MVTKLVETPLSTPLPVASDDPQLEWLRSQLLYSVHSLGQVHNARNLRRSIAELATKYTFVKWVMHRQLEEAAKKRGGWTELVRDMHSELYQVLNTGMKDIFLPGDRTILLDVLKENSRFVKLCDNIPNENTSSLYSAIMDGFAALQKLDLAITAIALIASKEVEIEDTRILHWLCLAARSYLRQFQSALFVNNPVLRNRLTTKARTISNEEMESRLGLSN